MKKCLCGWLMCYWLFWQWPPRRPRQRTNFDLKEFRLTWILLKDQRLCLNVHHQTRKTPSCFGAKYWHFDWFYYSSGLVDKRIRTQQIEFIRMDNLYQITSPELKYYPMVILKLNRRKIEINFYKKNHVLKIIKLYRIGLKRTKASMCARSVTIRL